ncbi:MAG TPA: hypothetical protein VGB22_10170 [candidate division Zixibacteria bacterium]|jgi:hypothetical protein
MKSTHVATASLVASLIVVLAACSRVTGSEGDSDHVVQIVNTPPAELLLDEFTLHTAAVIGDSLELFIQYGGGCKEHHFGMFMAPDLFIPTDLPQVMLFLRHDGNEDYCTANVPATLRFDLSPVAERYRQMYGEDAGAEVLLLHVFDDELREVISVEYELTESRSD